jgi:Zn-finger nucleic acid-binding protein
MAQEPHHGIAMWRCSSCKGAWIDHPSFFELLKHAPATLELEELMVHNDGSERRPCPVCKETMDIAWIDFLQLDQCEKHGIWFDSGELRRALAGEVCDEKQLQKIKKVYEQREKKKRSTSGTDAAIIAALFSD